VNLLKPFEWLWSKPPLVYIKPLLLKPLMKLHSRLMDEAWQKQLQKMDWPKADQNKSMDHSVEDSFALWEELIIQLANEYEAGEITAEEIASFLMPAADTFQFPNLKTQKPELQAIIHKVEEKSAQENNSLLQMAEKMTSRLEQKVTENLDPEKQKKLMEKINKIKIQNELAEKQRLAAIAANPEMIEGMTADQYTSQKQAQNKKSQVLKNEQKILRSKINEKKDVEKTFKQIGAEKQKALEKLNEDLNKKSKGSVGSSI